MKLTGSIFAEGVGLLAERWRDTSPALSAIMGEWLMAKGCTAEEFIAGVKRAIAEEDFCPNARKILELGRVETPAIAAAGLVFADVLLCRTHDPRWGMRLNVDTVRDRLGEPAMRAVIAVGVQRITNLTDDVYPFVLRDFTTAFVAFDKEARDRVSAGRFLSSGAVTSLEPKQVRRGGAPIQIGRIVDCISD